jgi:hypothetical protein
MENIGERFIAIKPIEKSQTTVNLTNIEGGKIHKGLNKVVATVLSKDGDEDGRKKEIPMIRKKITSADGYCEYWQRLREAGIPTIPTVRKINENEIIMTDLTKNESSFYGKDSVFGCFDRFKKNEINILDKHFLDIEVSDMEEKIKEVLRKANENNIVLPLDDPFDLLVHPNGNWEVLVLDLATENRDVSESETRVLNDECVSHFLDLLKLNRDSLLGKQPPSIVF